jgi:hypothetical protein
MGWVRAIFIGLALWAVVIGLLLFLPWLKAIREEYAAVLAPWAFVLAGLSILYNVVLDMRQRRLRRDVNGVVDDARLLAPYIRGLFDALRPSQPNRPAE